jgi:class 3 adenylate cyclase
MPIYMDRHYIEGATRHAIANAHEKDLATQGKYGLNFLTYWFDDKRCTAFCLVEAPDKQSIQHAHDEAHGDVPHEIIEVDPTVVEAFLGRVKDPPPTTPGGAPGIVESAFRVVMFTDLVDSTGMTIRLGESKAMHLLHIHNALIRNALRDHEGREVKHLGDGVMASFASITSAVRCAAAIQQAFAAHNSNPAESQLHVRIGLSAGEPVAEDNDLFGAAVQLAARLCEHARPDQILITRMIADETCDNASISAARLFTPKGFDEPVEILELAWA